MMLPNRREVYSDALENRNDCQSRGSVAWSGAASGVFAAGESLRGGAVSAEPHGAAVGSQTDAYGVRRSRRLHGVRSRQS